MDREYIIDKRLEYGLTQKELAYQADISTDLLGKIERGQLKITRKTRKKLEKAFKHFEYGGRVYDPDLWTRMVEEFEKRGLLIVNSEGKEVSSCDLETL